MSGPSLLGPAADAGPESLDLHLRRFGRRPHGGPELFDGLERSGLVGRGGASFPVALKWRSVASRGRSAVVIANGAEGEPLSRKDQTLMALRPHLVIDGALLAAESVGARSVVLYVGEAHAAALAAVTLALAERAAAERSLIRLLPAPASYVAGEETAAVHFVNSQAATPTATPPRPFESGVEGRPTLVQNVESLAHAALVARLGDGYSPSVLLTVGGAIARPGVLEVPSGTTVGEALALAGGVRGRARAVLLGGYFGGWIPAEEAASLRLDPRELKATGGSLGCGVVWVLDEAMPPLHATARVISHLAGESAAQCGPCFFGLRSLASATTRLAYGNGQRGEVERLRRWSEMVRGRGACRHPDGAVAFMQSALRVFAAEFEAA